MSPAEIRRLRERLNEKRPEFAKHFGHNGEHLSAQTIKAWELPVDSKWNRKPSPSALKILHSLQRKAFGQEGSD